MLLAILSICTQEELAESEESEGEAPSVEDVAARRQVIRNKILAVGRMQRVFQLLRFVGQASQGWQRADLVRTERKPRMLQSSKWTFLCPAAQVAPV
jgi:hypothetical protein